MKRYPILRSQPSTGYTQILLKESSECKDSSLKYVTTSNSKSSKHTNPFHSKIRSWLLSTATDELLM